jgi:hypothetical protein
MDGNQNLTWRKSPFSTGDTNGGECIEFAELSDGGFAIRDSKLRDASPILNYTKGELRAFVLGAKAGAFDDLI